jgi:hypothetical protein
MLQGVILAEYHFIGNQATLDFKTGVDNRGRALLFLEM